MGVFVDVFSGDAATVHLAPYIYYIEEDDGDEQADPAHRAEGVERRGAVGDCERRLWEGVGGQVAGVVVAGHGKEGDDHQGGSDAAQPNAVAARGEGAGGDAAEHEHHAKHEGHGPPPHRQIVVEVEVGDVGNRSVGAGLLAGGEAVSYTHLTLPTKLEV